jgi:hypothetical protein
MLSDLQRWLIRSSAKSMRKEIGGQVRRTFGGSERPGPAEVWDTATNEIPPEVGESPECQWCPICRAARRMRDSGPGLGGQLSGAGDAVASAVQDAIGTLDSILSKAGGGEPRAGSGSRPGSAGRSAPGPAAAAAEPDRGASKPADARPAASAGDGAAGADQHIAGDHGPGGWKPGDRLATAQIIEPDPWAGATDADDGSQARPRDGGPAGPGEAGGPGEAAGPRPVDGSGQADGLGHGPDDRG